MTFNVTIRMDNDAMQAPTDVADALRRLADRVEMIDGHVGRGTIRDLNGNTVGTFELTDDER